MRYTALDSWSDGQKTILRLFQVVTQIWNIAKGTTDPGVDCFDQ